MTKEAFIAKLMELAPWAKHYLTNEKLTLPKVCDMVAVYCFTERVQESEFTDALREQLLSLKHYGRFNFEPPTPDNYEGIIIRQKI